MVGSLHIQFTVQFAEAILAGHTTSARITYPRAICTLSCIVGSIQAEQNELEILHEYLTATYFVLHFPGR